MKNKIIFLVILMISINVLSQDKVMEIVKKANLNAYYQGNDGKAIVKMTITDKNDKKRTREFVILRKDKIDGGDQFFYVFFKKPQDVRKMVFMVWKHVGSDDDRWLYLPALDLVKRIAASDKRSSFVGSDFLYEDVSGRGIDEDNHELFEENDKFFILKSVPKDKASVEFSWYKLFIDKETYLPMKAEYYNDKNDIIRTVEALEKKVINGFSTITKSLVKNLETKSSTVLEFTNVKYDIGLKEKIFSERFLRRAPREVR